MQRSLLNKLFVLFAITLSLASAIFFSIDFISQEQKTTEREIKYLAQMQIGVDALRNQMWRFLQYQDHASLEQVLFAQQDLKHQLAQLQYRLDRLQNLIKMNDNLGVLLEQEKRVFFDDPNASRGASQNLLHARYNMVLQNMTEELSHAQHAILNHHSESLAIIIEYARFSMVFLALLACAVCGLILRRFRYGMQTISDAINRLGNGDFSHKIEEKALCREFSKLADFFNQTANSLSASTVSRNQLEHEVRKQTEELERQKERLLFLSEHDSLTNLMNRRAIEQQLEQAILRAHRTGGRIALYFIDLNKFKSVNDCYGHEAGDEVLKIIALRLHHCVRKTDFVGRLGGDEFVVCLDLLEDYDIVAHKALQFLEVIHRPVIYQNHDLSVGASIGVSYFPAQTSCKSKLIQLADDAMYYAKARKGSMCFDGSSFIAKLPENHTYPSNPEHLGLDDVHCTDSDDQILHVDKEVVYQAKQTLPTTDKTRHTEDKLNTPTTQKRELIKDTHSNRGDNPIGAGQVHGEFLLDEQG